MFVTPAVAGDLTLVGSCSGRYYAFEAGSGDILALDIEDGRTAWRIEPGGSGRIGLDNSPVVAGGTVYAPGTDGAVRAADAATGELRWRTELGCRINTGLAMGDGGIHVGCADGRIFRIARSDGTLAAEGKLAEGFPLGRPTPLAGAVVYLVGNNPMSGGGARFMALDADLESIRWEAHDQATWSSMQPLPWQGLLVVGNGAREVVGPRSDDGTVAWRRTLQGTIHGLGASDGLLLVGTLEGTVFALEDG